MSDDELMSAILGSHVSDWAEDVDEDMPVGSVPPQGVFPSNLAFDYGPQLFDVLALSPENNFRYKPATMHPKAYYDRVRKAAIKFNEQAMTDGFDAAISELRRVNNLQHKEILATMGALPISLGKETAPPSPSPPSVPKPRKGKKKAPPAKPSPSPAPSSSSAGSSRASADVDMPAAGDKTPRPSPILIPSPSPSPSSIAAPPAPPLFFPSTPTPKATPPPSFEPLILKKFEWATLFNLLDKASSFVEDCPDKERFAALLSHLAARPAVAPHVKPTAALYKIPRTIPAPAPLPPKPRPSAPAKAVAAPPSLPRRPAPQDAPPVSVAAKPKATRRRRGKHTTRGPSRRGVLLHPPSDSPIKAAAFTPEVIDGLNKLLSTDLHSENCITHADGGEGIFLHCIRTPTQAETAFVLKHVRRLFPSQSPQQTFAASTPSSTSYIKVLDVPIVHDPGAKTWVHTTAKAFDTALAASPAGMTLAKAIKHAPRFMRVSPHADSCIAWVDIHDSIAGLTARNLISHVVPILGRNCQIRGAKPHSGSVVCTRCMRWGHHFSKCRSKGVRCSLCGGPHSEDNHNSTVQPHLVNNRRCVNCVAAKKDKPTHSAMDRLACPFWKHRFDRDWLMRQFPAKDVSKAQRKFGAGV